jgi:hypothetical protein
MPVEILAAGTGVATSTAVTVTAAAPVTVGLKYAGGVIPNFTAVVTANGLPPIFIQSQDDAGTWNMTGEALTAEQPYLLLNRPGVYRVRRLQIDGAPSGIGVFRSDP